MSCLRVGCVWTEVQSALETQDEGRSVKLKEGTTVMIHVYTGREDRTSRYQDQQPEVELGRVRQSKVRPRSLIL